MSEENLQKKFEKGIASILEKKVGGVKEGEEENFLKAVAALAEHHVAPIREIRNTQ